MAEIVYNHVEDLIASPCLNSVPNRFGDDEGDGTNRSKLGQRSDNRLKRVGKLLAKQEFLPARKFLTVGLGDLTDRDLLSLSLRS